MAVAAAFSASGAALVATLPADGLVRVVSARDLRERFRYLLPGAYFATLCGDTSLLAVAATHGTVRVPNSPWKCTRRPSALSPPARPMQRFQRGALLPVRLLWAAHRLVAVRSVWGGHGGQRGPVPVDVLASASWASELAGPPLVALKSLQPRPIVMPIVVCFVP